MKWKKVSEHPFPECNYKKLYIVEWRSPNIRGLGYSLTENLTIYNCGGSEVLRFCEFNPDEIESSHEVGSVSGEPFGIPDFQRSSDNSKKSATQVEFERYKTASEIKGEYEDSQRMRLNQIKLAKMLSEDPSWEEKFRWETARMIFRDYLKSTKIIDNNVSDVILKSTDKLIAELKRGRE
jgi:hypothetical protein